MSASHRIAWLALALAGVAGVLLIAGLVGSAPRLQHAGLWTLLLVPVGKSLGCAALLSGRGRALGVVIAVVLIAIYAATMIGFLS